MTSDPQKGLLWCNGLLTKDISKPNRRTQTFWSGELELDRMWDPLPAITNSLLIKRRLNR
jgi:hypothetical protein